MKARLTALFLLAASAVGTLRADHIVGSDITYRCVRDSVFEVIYNFYRDCNGCYVLGQSPKCGTSENCNSNLTAPTAVSVTGTGTSCNRSFTLAMTRTSIVDITKTCSKERSRCAQPCGSSYPYGIEKHTFKGTLDLRAAMKAGCCEFTISMLLYVRSVGITTGQSGNTFYTWCDINACRAPCNNSPVLTNDPVAIVCCNQPYQFNNGALDSADRDSLSFSLAGSFRSQGSLASYNSPLSPKDPVPVYKGPTGKSATNPNAKPPIGMYCDSITGDLIFTPGGDCPWVGIIVMEIREWRRDSKGKMQLIGVTRRDMQFIATNCGPNNPPEIAGPYSYEVCEGEQLCFEVVTKDVQFTPQQTKPDTVTLNWNRGIPGATFTIVDPKAREKKGKFCWTPKVGQASDLLYSFTAIARDDNCPTPGTAIRSFRVKVKPRSVATRTYTKLICGKLRMHSTPSLNFKGKPIFRWQILDSTGKNPIYLSNGKQTDTFQFKRGGKYIISHMINSALTNCATFYSDTVIIPPVLAIDLGKDTFLCYGNTYRLSPIIVNGVSPYKYRWANPHTHNPADTNAFQDAVVSQDTAIALRLTDNNGCIATDTVRILMKVLPIVGIGPDQRICTYENTTFDAGHADTVRYRWFPTNDTTRVITVHKKNKYWVEVQETKWNCIGRDTADLFVNDTVIADAGKDFSFCLRDSVSITATAKPGWLTPNYLWTNLATSQAMGTKASYKVSPKVDQCYEVYLNITEVGHSCEDRDTICLKVKPLPDLKTTVPKRCYDYGDLNLGLESGLFTKFGNAVIYSCRTTPSLVEQVGNSYFYRTKKISNTSLQGGKNKTDVIICEYTDPKTGCYNKDSFTVVIQGNPIVQLRDRIWCQDIGCALMDSSIILPRVKTGALYNWTVLKAPSGVPTGSLVKDKNQGTGLPANWEFCFGDPTEDYYSGDYEMAFFIQDPISGCFTRDTSNVKIIPEPKVKVQPFPTFCLNDDTIDLNTYVTLNGMTNPPDGRWIAISKDGDRTDSKLSGAVLKNHLFIPANGDGDWEFRYIHDASGCYTADSGVLVVKPLPKVTMPADMKLCSTDPAINLAPTFVSPVGGSGVWSGKRLSGSGNSVFTPGSDQKSTVEGPYTLVYTYSDPFGCKMKDSFDILVQSNPSLNILTPDPSKMCDDQTLNLNSRLLWSPGVQWSSSGDGSYSKQDTTSVYTPGSNDKATGSVWLKVRNVAPAGNVCPAVADSMQLFIHAYPKFDFSGDLLAACEPLTVNFSSTLTSSNIPASQLSYVWDFGNGGNSTDANPQGISYPNWGKYNVSLTMLNTAGPCSTTVSKPAYVDVWPVPVADFTSDPSYYTTIALPKFQFYSKSRVADNSILKHYWNFGIGSGKDSSTKRDPGFAYGKDTAIYQVTLVVVSDKGCTDTMVRPVKIGPDIIVFIPNAFTPDDAGPNGNNRFLPFVQNFDAYHLTIFNRWGEKLFETTDATIGWDGTHQGVPVQQDVYAYVVEVSSADGKSYKFPGTVTLLR